MTQRLFRQKHPILFGLLILGAILTVFWGGVTFFIARAFDHQKSDLFGLTPGIGVISLEGVLVQSEAIIEELTDFRDNANVKAILIRIDSPGGAVGASQEIFQEIKRTAAVKPVVASMGSVAASGGYYAALGANKIFANAGTLTGSIGVILKFANLEKVFDKIGYKSEVIKSGKHKDIGSMARQMTDEERLLLQALIDDVHSQFVQAVAAERQIQEELVRPLADGRIFTGRQALELGLIDQLGNMTDAIQLAAKLGGIEEKIPHLIYPKEEGFSLFRILAGEKGQTALQSFLPDSPGLMYEWSLSQ